jgi:predicted 3-demethylubiquinone-9 3-methyltransferase (glyoxalase superfamily)
VTKAFARLSDGGTVLVPLGVYDFASRRFGWVTDRFVSWQRQVAQP